MRGRVLEEIFQQTDQPAQSKILELFQRRLRFYISVLALRKNGIELGARAGVCGRSRSG